MSSVTLDQVMDAIDQSYKSHRGYFDLTQDIYMDKFGIQTLDDVVQMHEYLLHTMGYGLNSVNHSSGKPYFKLISSRTCACKSNLIARLHWINNEGRMSLLRMSYYCPDCKIDSM